MEVPRLGVESELQLPAYSTATQDPNRICYLHHSSWQHRILNPLWEARDPTWVLMDTNQVHYCWATMGTPVASFNIKGHLSSSLRRGYYFCCCLAVSMACVSSQARDWTHASAAIQAVPVRFLSHCTTVGTPALDIFYGWRTGLHESFVKRYLLSSCFIQRR